MAWHERNVSAAEPKRKSQATLGTRRCCNCKRGDGGWQDLSMASACGAVYARLGGLTTDRLTLSGSTGSRFVPYVLYGYSARSKCCFRLNAMSLIETSRLADGKLNVAVLYYVALCNMRQTPFGDQLSRPTRDCTSQILLLSKLCLHRVTCS